MTWATSSLRQYLARAARSVTAFVEGSCNTKPFALARAEAEETQAPGELYVAGQLSSRLRIALEFDLLDIGYPIRPPDCLIPDVRERGCPRVDKLIDATNAHLFAHALACLFLVADHPRPVRQFLD